MKAILLAIALVSCVDGFTVRLNRRSAVVGAMGAAVSSIPGAALATGAEQDAALYDEEDHNEDGSADVYMPSIRLESAGSANSKLSVVMPAKGPRTAGDFVDCM